MAMRLACGWRPQRRAAPVAAELTRTGSAVALCDAWGSWAGIEPESLATAVMMEALRHSETPCIAAIEAVFERARVALNGLPEDPEGWLNPATNALAALATPTTCVVGWLGNISARVHRRDGSEDCTAPHVLGAKEPLLQPEHPLFSVPTQLLGQHQGRPEVVTWRGLEPGDILIIANSDVTEFLQALDCPQPDDLDRWLAAVDAMAYAARREWSDQDRVRPIGRDEGWSSGPVVAVVIAE